MEKEEAGAGTGTGIVTANEQAMDIDSYGDNDGRYGEGGHDP